MKRLETDTFRLGHCCVLYRCQLEVYVVAATRAPKRCVRRIEAILVSTMHPLLSGNPFGNKRLCPYL